MSDYLKGIITYLAPTRDGQATKLRVGPLTWAYIKERLPDEFLGSAVLLEGEWRPSQRIGKYFLVSRFSVASIFDWDKSIKSIRKKIEKEGIKITETRFEVMRRMLIILYAMKKQALLLKFLKWNERKQNKYLSNPLQLCLDKHLDFYSADVLARNLVEVNKFEDRLYAFCFYKLEDEYKNNRDSVPVDEIKDCAERFFGQKIGIDIVALSARYGSKVLFENDYGYLAKVYFLRKKIAKKFKEENSFFHACYGDDSMREILSRRWVVLSGAPGTGKTTLLKKLKDTNLKVVYAATTGKAAKLLGDDVVTVHSLLGFGPKGFSIKHLGDCDILVVDEASMLDWWTLHAIVEAAPRVIFSGDPNQLPPVHGEPVFKKMIELLPSVHLEKNWRFISGTAPDITVIPRKSKTEILSTVKTLAIDLYRKKANFQVITPVKDRMLGTYRLNSYLQDVLNKNSTPIGKTKRLRIGDRVIVNKNIYVQGVLIASNGTTGTVSGEQRGFIEVIANGYKVYIEEKDLELAYVITVHRSQGSEYDYSIFIVPSDVGSEFLSEELMLVGKTRGKVKNYVVQEHTVPALQE